LTRSGCVKGVAAREPESVSQRAPQSQGPKRSTSRARSCGLGIAHHGTTPLSRPSPPRSRSSRRSAPTPPSPPKAHGDEQAAMVLVGLVHRHHVWVIEAGGQP
jgi:hypothetical protein